MKCAPDETTSAELLEKEARRRAREQVSAWVAKGLQRWPRPAARVNEEDNSVLLKGTQLGSRRVMPSAASGVQEISKCRACALCEVRTRVVHTKQLTAKKFYVLGDFPEAPEEQSDEGPFSAPEAANNLLERLFQRLGLWDQVFPAFAVKCFPRTNLPPNALLNCTVNVATELAFAQPEVIVCFGNRAARSLEEVLGMSLPLSEMGEISSQAFLDLWMQMQLEDAEKSARNAAWKNLKRIFFFPTSRELRDYPDWRKQVWQELQVIANRTDSSAQNSSKA